MSMSNSSAKIKQPPVTLVSHHDVADWWGVTPKLIRRWVAAGSFARPHSEHGTYLFFDRAVIEHRLKTGAWPRGTKFYGDTKDDVEQNHGS